MSERPTKLPAIPPAGRTTEELSRSVSAIREGLEVGLGRRGDPLDGFVTFRALRDGGVASIGTKPGRGAIITGVPARPGDGAPIFDPDAPDFGEGDFTPPLAPENVVAYGVPPDTIAVSWDPPNYSNHAYAEVFYLSEQAGVLPTYEDLVAAAPGFDPVRPVGESNPHPALQGTAGGTFYFHTELPLIIRPGDTALQAALNPGRYVYWVRFVSTAGVAGPFAPVPTGAIGQLAADPVRVLDAMAAGIESSTIYENLRSYFGTSNNGPIFDAGGVRAFVNEQDEEIASSVRDRFLNIIGVSAQQYDDNQQPGGVSAFAAIGEVMGIATENESTLEQLEIWQAGLSTVAGNANQQKNVVGYSMGASGASGLFTMSSAHGMSVGSRFYLSTSGTGLDTLSYQWMRVQSVTSQFAIVAIPDVAGGFFYPPTSIVNLGAPGAFCRLIPQGGVDDVAEFLATIRDAVFVNVDPGSAIARRFTTIDATVNGFSGTIGEFQQTIATIDGYIDSIWSVRMQQEANGLVYAAGFGLGLTTDAITGQSLSTFLVNANQFAVMGPNAPGARVVSFARVDSKKANLTLATPAHLFRDGQKITISADPGPDASPSPWRPIIGYDALILSGQGSAVLLVEIQDSRTWPAGGAGNPDPKWRCAVIGESSIPFIVDTVNNVVGIRGSLIVDGLVRSQLGQFDVLTAQTGFIQHLTSEVVNANVVIGQRIIAGTPGRGAINDQAVSEISNYIIELNNPVGGRPPLRYYKPSTGAVTAELDTLGNFKIGGNLSVGGNGVIATNDPFGAVASFGGAGQDGRYALWIGPKSDYGVAGEQRRETNAFLFVKQPATAGGSTRLGIRGDLFLGDDAFTMPSGNGTITVKPQRNGQASRVFASMTFAFINQDSGENRNCWVQADLYLVPVTFTGPGAGIPRAGIGFEPSQEFVNRHAGWYESGPNLPPGGALVASTQIDSRNGAHDVKNGSLQGSTVLAPGEYKVFLSLWKKGDITGDGDGKNAIVSVHAFAMQTMSGGGAPA